MSTISEEQRKLIKEYGGGKVKNGFDFVQLFNNLFAFIENKSEDEPIDKELIDIWTTAKRYLDEIPNNYRIRPDFIKDIEEKFKSSECLNYANNIIIDDDTNVAFLLGAGASAPSNIPTVNSLLPELWKRTRKIGRDDLNDLANFCEERGLVNRRFVNCSIYFELCGKER